MAPTTDLTRRRTIEFTAIAVIAALMLVGLPLLHAGGALSNYWISVIGKWLSYAILALSVDLLWGYTGLLGLGQAMLFSFGGYMHGMYLMRMIGDLGQYKKPIPDFLVFLGWQELPSFWVPMSSFALAVTLVVLVPGLIALGFGYLAFRSRIRGVYFSILTQALTYAAMIIFFRNNLLMGGNNGFTDFRFILGYSLFDAEERGRTLRWLYVVTGGVLLLVYLFRRWLNYTKFGLVQRAIRDGENRVLFSGYAAANFKLFVFVVAAVIAGIGGALYVPQAGIINPEEMKPEKSLEAVVWVAVGGRGTLLGPVIGAIFVNALKSWATVGATADFWLFILGGLFVLVVLCLPGGLVSYPAEVRKSCGGQPLPTILFSPAGRMPRVTFWYVHVVAVVGLITCSLIFHRIGESAGWALFHSFKTSVGLVVFGAALAALGWVLVVANRKRLHDLDLSSVLGGLYALVPLSWFLVPLLGGGVGSSALVAVLMAVAWAMSLGWVNGAEEPNRFGANPLTGPAATSAAANGRENGRTTSAGASTG